MTKECLFLPLELDEFDTCDYLEQVNYLITQEYLLQYYLDIRACVLLIVIHSLAGLLIKEHKHLDL